LLRRVAVADLVEAGGELMQAVELFFFEALVQGALYAVSAPRALGRLRGGGWRGLVGRRSRHGIIREWAKNSEASGRARLVRRPRATFRHDAILPTPVPEPEL
jgi:hypothetical protein